MKQHPRLTYRPPTHEDILAVASTMREDDVLEVAAANGHTPLQALIYSVEESDVSVCALVDDVPVCIFGIAFEHAKHRASVWLLGAEGLPPAARIFVPEAKRILTEWANHCGVIYNWVAAANAITVRWLKRVGFEIEDECADYGVGSQPFLKMVKRGV